MTCRNCQREIAEYSNFCYYCGARQVVSNPAAGAPNVPPKRLMRSSTDVKIAGVCGGVAEYLDADPTVVRLIWAILTLLSGFFFGLLGYVIAWMVMPVAPVYVPAPAAQQNPAQSPRPA